jgi:glycerol uptake facilitator-like aquaporin
MRQKSFCATALCAAVVAIFGAGSAFAGEVTGSGKKENQNQGLSWCSFSGLNDQLQGEGPVGPMAQSFGIEVTLGISDPHTGNPGFFCNPTRTPLPPNPNRTH